MAKSVDGELTREQIVAAAEEALRRFGPHKTTVVDIARTLGVSHGSVYRHFESKAALHDAVVEVWLRRLSSSLEKLVKQPGSARDRLRLWLDTMRSLKTKKYQQEAELFATYHKLAWDCAHAVANYRSELVGQLETMIRGGIASGEFHVADAGMTARAVFDATLRFHHPWHAVDWQTADIDAAFEGVWDLMLQGLSHTDRLPKPTVPRNSKAATSASPAR